MLSLKGPCQTVIGSRTAGLDALRIATERIASGEWDRAIVGAAEEYAPVVNSAYAHWGLQGPAGFRGGAGAVTLLLESRSSCESRGVRPRGKVVAAAGGMSQAGGIPRLVRRVYQQIGSPSFLMGSANGTWIDRAESAAVPRGGSVLVSSIRGYVNECQSATSLAALSAVLLTGRLPSHTERALKTFGVLTTDYFGSVSGVAIEPAFS